MALRVISTRRNPSCGCWSAGTNRQSMKPARCFSSTTIPEKAWRKIFEEFSQKNNFGTQEWYQVDIKTLDEPTVQLVKKEFKGSLYNALSSLFPEREWLPWKFQQRTPSNFWNSTDNQRKYFDWLGKELGIKKLDDWYTNLSIEKVKETGGSGLLSLKKGSARSALISAYPEHNWTLSKFLADRSGVWYSLQAQTEFFNWFGKEIGIKHLDDWYEKLTVDTLKANGGGGLLALKQSPASILMAVYPEHNWMPWKFKVMIPRLWSSRENQRKYFDWLGKELQIQQLDDWYEKISAATMLEHGGATLLSQFQGSPSAAIMAAYPDHNWLPWKFNKTKGTWDSPENIKQFLSELSEKLSIQTLDDWYRVDRKQLSSFGGGWVLFKYNGLYNVLKEQYPNHPWDPKKFRQAGKKGQRWLAVTLKKMFPNEEILEDYMHHKTLLPSSSRPMQLDVFIPSRSLAFEYQGQQHYEDVGVFSPSRVYQQRDEEKRILCAANNIKLIEVPYWWNRTQESLQEMMQKASQ